MTSDFIPNSYQTPNAYVDRFMHLLTSEEWKVLSYTARRIFGFRKVNHQDRISLSQYATGIRSKDRQLDYGTGLSKPTVMHALAKLKEYRLIIEVLPGDQRKNLAPLYELQLDSDLVDVAGLEQRAAQARGRNLKRTTTARSKAAEKHAADTLVNGIEQGTPVQSDLPALVNGTEQALVNPIDQPLVNGTEQTYSIGLTHNNQGKKEKERSPSPPVAGNDQIGGGGDEIVRILDEYNIGAADHIAGLYKAKYPLIDAATVRQSIDNLLADGIPKAVIVNRLKNRPPDPGRPYQRSRTTPKLASAPSSKPAIPSDVLTPAQAADIARARRGTP
jgi:hypothetical protein